MQVVTTTMTTGEGGMVKEFAKVIHDPSNAKQDRKIVFVNLAPPPAEWKEVIDFHISGETDKWTEKYPYPYSIFLLYFLKIRLVPVQYPLCVESNLAYERFARDRCNRDTRTVNAPRVSGGYRERAHLR